jgi:hypothetical protein
VYAEDAEKLNTIVGLLPDDRLAAIVRSAAASDQFDDAVMLLTRLDSANQVRIVRIAAGSGDSVVNGIVSAVVRNDVWSYALALLPDGPRRRLVNVPATLERQVLSVVLRTIRTLNLGPVLGLVLSAMDDEHLASLSDVPELTEPATREWLINHAELSHRLSPILFGQLHPGG